MLQTTQLSAHDRWRPTRTACKSVKNTELKKKKASSKEAGPPLPGRPYNKTPKQQSPNPLYQRTVSAANLQCSNTRNAALVPTRIGAKLICLTPPPNTAHPHSRRWHSHCCNLFLGSSSQKPLQTLTDNKSSYKINEKYPYQNSEQYFSPSKLFSCKSLIRNRDPQSADSCFPADKLT